jgi:hypothetical protein
MMGDRFSASMITVAITAAAVSTAISVPATRTSAQGPAFSNAALKTPWGEPDLQGIWTEEFDTPLQRPAQYANQEFFTETQRQELDKRRATHYGDDPRQQRGSAVDVGGAYNTTFLTIRAFPEKTESGGIPIRTRIGFKIRAGKEASMGWGSRIRRICVRAW